MKGEPSKPLLGGYLVSVNSDNRIFHIAHSPSIPISQPNAQNRLLSSQKESIKDDDGDPSKLPLSLGKSILEIPSCPTKGHMEVIIECLDEDEGQSGSDKGLPFGLIQSLAIAER